MKGRTMIRTPADFGKALKAPYAWPGGYPLFFITADGAALCHACGRKEARQITAAIRDRDRHGGWCVEAQDVNWEDGTMICDHCSGRIESAYAEA